MDGGAACCAAAGANPRWEGLTPPASPGGDSAAGTRGDQLGSDPTIPSSPPLAPSPSLPTPDPISLCALREAAGTQVCPGQELMPRVEINHTNSSSGHRTRAQAARMSPPSCRVRGAMEAGTSSIPSSHQPNWDGAIELPLVGVNEFLCSSSPPTNHYGMN